MTGPETFDDSQRIDEVRKAQKMAEASDHTRSFAEIWKKDKAPSKRVDSHIKQLENRAEKQEELAGIEYDLREFGHTIAIGDLMEIKRILDKNRNNPRW